MNLSLVVSAAAEASELAVSETASTSVATMYLPIMSRSSKVENGCSRGATAMPGRSARIEGFREGAQATHRYADHNDNSANTMDAAAITAVAAQPPTARVFEMRNLPMTDLRALTSRIRAMMGAATMPFNTAAQTSALSGLSETTFSMAPRKVASAIAA